MAGRHRRKSRTAKLGASLLRLVKAARLVTRAEHNNHPTPADLHVVAPATLTTPVIPDDVADIDPAQQPPELPARTTSEARAAVAAADIPAGLIDWTYHPDRADGIVTQDPDVDDSRRRGVVAAIAATLGVQVAEHDRSDGFATVSAAGAHPDHPGVRIAVTAMCCRDVTQPLAAFEQAVEDLAADWPDTEPAGEPIPVPAAPRRLALPAPREAT